MQKLAFLALILSSLIRGPALAQSYNVDYYLEKGLKNSPLLKDYSNQLHSGRIDSLLVLCGYKPTVDLTSQLLFSPASSHFGYDEAITNGGNYTALMGVKQSLLNKNTRTAQMQSLGLLRQSLEVSKILTQSELKKSIISQYISAFADFGQLEFVRKTLELLSGQQKMVKIMAESGIYQQTDLMNLSIAIKAQEIARKQAHMQFKNDLALLNLLCGIVDTTEVALMKPDLRIMNLFSVASSPIYLQSRIDSLKNLNARAMLNLSYRPKLEAFADAGFMAVKPLNIPSNFGSSIGLNFSMPLYDGHQREQQYSKIELAENTRKIYLDAYTSQYMQQLRQLQEQLSLSEDLISEINSQLLQQKELIALYRTEMEQGLVRFTDYLAIINSYSLTQNSLTVAEMNRLQLINQLNYLK